jgi:acyl-CoA hydrolase
MGFESEYQRKLTTAEEAVKVVKSGDWIDYGWCCGHPVALDEALAKRAADLEDLKLRGGICLWRPAIFDIENAADHITWNSWHMSGIERKAIAEGIAFYAPIRYSELPRYYREHIKPNDVAMFQVTPMDEHGYFNRR